MSIEIDRLVAEKVLKVFHEEYNGVLYAWVGNGEDTVLFQPSLNISDAWFVLDKVCKENNWRAIIDRNNEQTEVNFKNQMGSNIQYYGIAETPMLAICIAVLDSVGIKI